MAWREWARLSVRAQWRQSRRYQRLAAALRALEPAALAGLGERDRRMLGWYYGLDGAEVLDYSQIAARLDLSRQVVKERLHRVLAHLLGGEVVHVAGDRGGTTPDRCPVCRGVRDQRRSRGRAGTGPVPEPGAP